jgi:copper chaperone CopZ
MKADKFKIKGDAKPQAKSIHNSIAKLDGIKAIRVDSLANTVTVDYDDEKITSSQIESTLKDNKFM